MRHLVAVCFVLLLSFLTGIAQNNPNQFNLRLKTGDLIFCSSTSGILSKAIDQATQTGKNTHFDHIGIAEVLNDTVWVLHAAPEKGVVRETIQQFLTSGNEKAEATLFRLKDNFQSVIPAAIRQGHNLLGQPYNYSYILEDKGYYCSEYIYELFASDSIFTLNPMTFKNPETGQFLPGWISHYQKLGIEVPEGKPGCNPNGMAASEKLVVIGALELKRKK